MLIINVRFNKHCVLEHEVMNLFTHGEHKDPNLLMKLEVVKFIIHTENLALAIKILW